MWLLKTAGVLNFMAGAVNLTVLGVTTIHGQPSIAALALLTANAATFWLIRDSVRTDKAARRLDRQSRIERLERELLD